MSETAESGPVLPETPFGGDAEEMSERELRGCVCKRAGTNERWGTRVTTETINSAYAYITGSFLIPKEALHNPDHTRYKSRERMLCLLVGEAGIGEPEDRWSPGADGQPAKLTEAELRALLEKMRETGDRRSWTQGDDAE